MEIIFVLLPLSILLACAALGAYFWSVRSGQFDDLETPAMRMLFEEEKKDPPEEKDPISTDEQ